MLFSLLALCGFAFATRDPMGGEPYAVASIEKVEPKPDRVETPAAPQSVGAPAEPAEPPSIAEQLEAESGIVVHRGPGTPPGAKILQVPDDPASAPGKLDRTLSESSRHGVLPVISADGRRPLDVYARPLDEGKAGKKPRIAIIVGGLGIGESITNRAIRRLPGEVTLAFAPYGGQLSRQVARARENGHEVMLHAPMEPYDYPTMIPARRLWFRGQKPGATQDRLHWLMSRFQGYVGVVNFMGAKFMSSDQDFQIVASELARRGLGFIQDGSTVDDGAAALMRANGGAAARADVVIDITTEAKEIDASLARLEAIAKEKRPCDRHGGGVAGQHRAAGGVDERTFRQRHRAGFPPAR